MELYLFLSVMETDRLQQCSSIQCQCGYESGVQQHQGSQSSCLQLHNLLMDIDLAGRGSRSSRSRPSPATLAPGAAASPPTSNSPHLTRTSKEFRSGKADWEDQNLALPSGARRVNTSTLSTQSRCCRGDMMCC